MQDYSKLNTEDLLLLREQLQFDVSKYHNFQLVRKIQLNSAYGAVG